MILHVHKISENVHDKILSWWFNRLWGLGAGILGCGFPVKWCLMTTGTRLFRGPSHQKKRSIPVAECVNMFLQFKHIQKIISWPWLLHLKVCIHLKNEVMHVYLRLRERLHQRPMAMASNVKQLSLATATDGTRSLPTARCGAFGEWLSRRRIDLLGKAKCLQIISSHACTRCRSDCSSSDSVLVLLMHWDFIWPSLLYFTCFTSLLFSSGSFCFCGSF